MASLYQRKDSKFWYIRYRDKAGKWKDKSTGLRATHILETRMARKIVRAKTLEEYEPINEEISWDWVIPWMEVTFSGKSLSAYRVRYDHLSEFLAEKAITSARALTREWILSYVTWRVAQGACKNTAISEISFLRQLLKEALLRDYCDRNVACDLRLKGEERRPKIPWTDEEIHTVGSVLKANTEEYFLWMFVTFLFGLYQACRIQQCSIPLECVSIDRKIITYPASRVKGGRPFAHRIDPAFVHTLKHICENRRNSGHSTTCDLPLLPSLEWRRFLDQLGYRHLTHHGLRVTWITRAALAGVPENIAMRFVNHASTSVHRIYQKIRPHDQGPFLDRLSLPQIGTDNAP